VNPVSDKVIWRYGLSIRAKKFAGDFAYYETDQPPSKKPIFIQYSLITPQP